MTDTAVRPACSKCGAEIREGSLYCYGCGLPVAEVSAAADRPATASAEPTREPAADINAELEKAHAAAAVPTARPTGAARRRPARPEPKMVEVVWAEPQGISLSFILGSVILIFMVIVVVAIALYLK